VKSALSRPISRRSVARVEADRRLSSGSRGSKPLRRADSASAGSPRAAAGDVLSATLDGVADGRSDTPSI
jgi:hypothetical protein